MVDEVQRPAASNPPGAQPAQEGGTGAASHPCPGVERYLDLSALGGKSCFYDRGISIKE